MSLRFETATRDYQCNLCGKLSKHGAIAHAYDEHNRYVGDSCRKCDGFWTAGSQKQDFIPIPKSEKKQTKRFKVDTTTIRFTDYDHGEFLQGNDKRQCTRLEDGNWYWGGGVSSGLRHIGNISKTNSIHNAKTIIITEGYTDSKTVNEYYHNNPDYFACFIHGQKKHIYSELLETKELIFIHDIDKTGERERDNFVKQYPHTKIITHPKYNYKTVGKKDITELVAEGWDIQEVVDTAKNNPYIPNGTMTCNKKGHHLTKDLQTYSINKQYLQGIPMNRKYTLLESNTGTGKTTFALNYAKENGTCLHISGRERISIQVAETHKINCYKDKNLTITNNGEKDLDYHSTICYDSIYKLKDLEKSDVILVIDETSLIMERMTYSQKQVECIQAFQSLLLDCKQIIIADACIHTAFIKFLEDVKPEFKKDALLIQNSYIKDTDKVCTIYPSDTISSTHFNLELQTKIKNGYKVGLACDTKHEAEKFAAAFCDQGVKTKLITSESNKDTRHLDVKDFQLVIYTQSCFVGVDWNIPEFEHVFFSGKHVITTSEDIRQAVNRFRCAKYVYINTRGSHTDIEGKSLSEIMNKIELNYSEYNKSIAKLGKSIADVHIGANAIKKYIGVIQCERKTKCMEIYNLMQKEGYKTSKVTLSIEHQDTYNLYEGFNLNLSKEIRKDRLEFLNMVLTHENCNDLQHYNDMDTIVHLKKVRDIIGTVDIDAKLKKRSYDDDIDIKTILELSMKHDTNTIKKLPKALMNAYKYKNKDWSWREEVNTDITQNRMISLNTGFKHSRVDMQLRDECIMTLLKYCANNPELNYHEYGEAILYTLIDICESQERFERLLTPLMVDYKTNKIKVVETIQNIFQKEFNSMIKLKCTKRWSKVRFYSLVSNPIMKELYSMAKKITVSCNSYRTTNTSCMTLEMKETVRELEIADKHAFLKHGEQFLWISPYLE